VKRFGHAALILVSSHNGSEPDVFLARLQFMRVLKEWSDKYLSPAVHNDVSRGTSGLE